MSLIPPINSTKATHLSFWITLLIIVLQNQILKHLYLPISFFIMISGIVLQTENFKKLQNIFSINNYINYFFPFILLYSTTKNRSFDKLNLSVLFLLFCLYNLIIGNVWEIYGDDITISLLSSFLCIICYIIIDSYRF